MLKRNELGQCKKLIIIIIIIVIIKIIIIKMNKLIVKVGLLSTMLNHVFQNMTGSTFLCFNEKNQVRTKCKILE